MTGEPSEVCIYFYEEIKSMRKRGGDWVLVEGRGQGLVMKRINPLNANVAVI